MATVALLFIVACGTTYFVYSAYSKYKLTNAEGYWTQKLHENDKEVPASERYATEYKEEDYEPVDMSDAPEGLKNGLVTPQYFMTLNINFDKWLELNNAWRASLNSGNTDGLIEKHIAFAEWIEDNLYIEPENFEERVIHEYLIDYRESAENLVSSRITYINSGISYDLSRADEDYRKAKANLINVKDVMLKYDLFYD